MNETILFSTVLMAAWFYREQVKAIIQSIRKPARSRQTAGERGER